MEFLMYQNGWFIIFWTENVPFLGEKIIKRKLMNKINIQLNLFWECFRGKRYKGSHMWKTKISTFLSHFSSFLPISRQFSKNFDPPVRKIIMGTLHKIQRHSKSLFFVIKKFDVAGGGVKPPPPQGTRTVM